MTKKYKRKQNIEANSRDSKGCNDIKKSLNSTERQVGKKECEEGELDSLNHNIGALKIQIEMQMSYDCHTKETEAARNSKPYNCTCPDVFKWSDDQVLEYLGLK